MTATNRTTAELREAFNAGYSYGIESEASPEEYDAAWKFYMQSGRLPQPPALSGIVEEIDGLLIELDATKEAAEAIPGLGAAKEVQDAEGNLAAALVNAWPTLRANLKQEEWRPEIGERVQIVGEFESDWRGIHPKVVGINLNRFEWQGEGELDYTVQEYDGGGQTDGFSIDELRPLPNPPQSKKEG